MSHDKPIEALDMLTSAAKHEQKIIDGIDVQIAELQKERAARSKILRSTTSKIVTLQIKGAA